MRCRQVAEHNAWSPMMASGNVGRRSQRSKASARFNMG
jgi:hypothetical protein